MNSMTTCDEVMRELWDYLDGELTTERMLAIEAHLAECERCHPQADFSRAFLRAVSRAMRRAVPHSVALAQRVREMLRLEGFSSV